MKWTGPDFVVIGAAKAGTTAIWSWLRTHPDLFLPDVKEPGYFAFADRDPRPSRGPFDPKYISSITTKWSAYGALYQYSAGRKCGDVSPVYAVSETALPRLRSCRPDTRIVMVLRHPARRAFSQYLHHRRDALEPLDTFEAALAAERSRQKQGWSWAHAYAGGSNYLPQIQRLMGNFPRQQILFLEHEAIRATPEVCWHRLCKFLGVATPPMPDNQMVNVTEGLVATPSRPFFERMVRHPGSLQKKLKRVLPGSARSAIRKVLSGRSVPVATLSTDTARQIMRLYKADLPDLRARTGLPLHWT
nr:sulfotransferase [Palleronia caenipelagi]